MGDGDQKGNPIDKHWVTAKSDILVLLKDRRWYCHAHWSDGWRVGVHCFPFEEADVGTKDVVCSQGVHFGHWAVWLKVTGDDADVLPDSGMANPNLHLPSLDCM